MLAAAVLLALAAVPESSDVPELNRAREQFASMHYEQALKSLAKAITSPGLTPESRAQIYLYTGLCRHQNGDEKGASKAFKEALTIDQKIELPGEVSPKARRAFERVKSEVAAENPPPREEPKVEEKPQPPPEPPPMVPVPAVTLPVQAVVEPPPSKRHWWPAVVGGVLAAASLGVGIYFGVNAGTTRHNADLQMFGSEGFKLTQSAQSQALAANVLFGVAAVLAAFGVVGVFVF